MVGRVRLWSVGALALAAVFALALAWRPAIAPVVPPSRQSFAVTAIARGADLARIGDCAVCHTALGGAPYAGGRAIASPFGVVYASNLTPDAQTGVGRWSLTAFRRALTQGVARNGAHLYPAMPYDHFAELSDPDIAALYAFVMTRTPVHAVPPANRLDFPLGFRPLLAGWKHLYLPRPATTPPGSGPSNELSRGRYLVESLGHCGACHSPHNRLGAENHDQPLAGGWAEGWYVPPLNARSPAARPWPADALHLYLRTGLSPGHAAAAGPMGPVTRQLADAPDFDVWAIAAYVAQSMRGSRLASTVDRWEYAGHRYPGGARLFAGACAACHDSGAPMMNEGRPNLALGTSLHEAGPRDVIQVILHGLEPPVGRAGPTMPAFADSLRDRDLAQLISYLRARYTAQPPWSGDLAQEIGDARKGVGG